ncbi:hypothetical protein Scep_012481 [Stephania cephalantha]|uniref:Uncharacterized protein n=1 Tax=Stephania cephalantha TaxID=152367 RepID=A0AAP0P6R3_9MAGN
MLTREIYPEEVRRLNTMDRMEATDGAVEVVEPEGRGILLNLIITDIAVDVLTNPSSLDADVAELHGLQSFHAENFDLRKQVKDSDIVLTTATRKDDLMEYIMEEMRHKLEVSVSDS